MLLNGRWFHVDVTWDDLDNEEFPDAVSYRYMNVGNEHMRSDHRWTEDEVSFVPLSEYTDWDNFFYTGWNEGYDFESAYYKNVNDCAAYIRNQKKAGEMLMYVMTDREKLGYSALSEAMKKTDIYGRWTRWTYPLGEYTCFMAAFSK